MILRSMRFLGALALLAVGAVHLQQYIAADYRAIPTIEPLFLLNAIGSGVVSIGLLLPVDRPSTARLGRVVVGVLALGAVAIAAASLAALSVSESGSLFGFSESGFRTVIVVAIVAEAPTIVLLAPVAAVSLGQAFPTTREATGRRGRGRAAWPDQGAAT